MNATVSTSAGPTGTDDPAADAPTMRDRLVGAALGVLQRDGAAGLTVRAITAEAGCSTTGVYTYFGGKHGVVDAIYTDGFESFDAAIAPALADGDLLAAGLNYRRWALDHPTQYMVMFGSAVPDYEPSPAASERSLASFAGLVAGVERSGGVIDGGAETVAYHLFATVHGYVMLELVANRLAVDVPADELYESALMRLMR